MRQGAARRVRLDAVAYPRCPRRMNDQLPGPGSCHGATTAGRRCAGNSSSGPTAHSFPTPPAHGLAAVATNDQPDSAAYGRTALVRTGANAWFRIKSARIRTNACGGRQPPRAASCVCIRS